jgi:hypothetical protein
MPGGLITGDYQVELNGLLMGATTEYQIDVAGIKGLGNAPAKTADSQFAGRHGSSGAPDFFDVRMITIPIKVISDTPEDAWASFGALLNAWTVATDGVDVELHIQLPGFGHNFYIGRARGCDDDQSLLKNSIIGGLCRFDALNPETQPYTP